MEDTLNKDDEPKEYQAGTRQTEPRGGFPSLPPLSATPLPPKLPKSAGLALVLSVFPGLGQIYNGQSAKALTFFSCWVGCIYGAAEIAPLPFGLLIPFVYFYNLVDAYRSAALINARALGGAPPVEEDVSESPAWGATLLGLGLVLLLNNLGWLRLEAWEKYWPVLLIVAGGVFLYRSLGRRKSNGAAGTDDGHTGLY